MDPFAILFDFYPEDTPLRKLLLKHSCQVRDKALEIMDMKENAALPLDRETVVNGALLHDIGVVLCHAPAILCEGHDNYLRHGLIGAQMLREYAAQHHLTLEKYAKICERHTGSGLAAQEIIDQKLPLPPQDFLPETNEEKLICLADKFFSKSGQMREKPVGQVWTSLDKFGIHAANRLHDLFDCFHLKHC